MKKIAILSSGGDAPGMNAAIRAIVRSSLKLNMQPYGVLRGYDGLIDNEFMLLNISSVADIIHKGGTMLKTARSHRFMTEAGKSLAISNLKNNDIDALIVIGGDGSLKGSVELTALGINVIVIPSTIDNDMGCSEYTLGFDTAVNTALDSISKIRDTASSFDKTTIIEVMGRNCGDIAIQSGLSGGADYILLPEIEVDMEELISKIKKSSNRNKTRSIIVKAEGAGISNENLIEEITNATGEKPSLTVLGYTQRGGAPSNKDRRIASLMGVYAVDLINEDNYNQVICVNGNDLESMDISEGVKLNRAPDLELLTLILDLS